jgi:hypothetical protein
VVLVDVVRLLTERREGEGKMGAARREEEGRLGFTEASRWLYGEVKVEEGEDHSMGAVVTESNTRGSCSRGGRGQRARLLLEPVREVGLGWKR